MPEHPGYTTNIFDKIPNPDVAVAADADVAQGRPHKFRAHIAAGIFITGVVLNSIIISQNLTFKHWWPGL